MAAKKRAPKKRAAKTRPAKKPSRPSRQQPESLRLRELAVSLTVSDLDKASAWYRDVLGFTEGERWQDAGRPLGIQLKAGSVELMLNQDDFSKGREGPKGTGARLWATTGQDLDQLAAMIKQRGGTLTHEPGDLAWGGRAFALTDPDGYVWTVVEA